MQVKFIFLFKKFVLSLIEFKICIMKDNRKNRKKQQLKRKFEFINGVIPFKVGYCYKITDDSELNQRDNEIDDKLNQQFNNFINKYNLNKYKHLFIAIKENKRVGQVKYDFIKDLKTVVFERYYKSKLSKD